MIMVARKTPLLRPVLLAATLAAGFGTLWIVPVTWLGVAILEAWPGRSRPPQESLVVATDGTPLIQSMRLDNHQTLVTYRDLDGRVRSDLERKFQNPAFLYGEAEDPFLSRPDWSQRIKVFVNEREPDSVWYFVHDGHPAGSGYFVGYERVSNHRIGFIGLSGFRDQSVAPEDRIPVRGDRIRDYNQYWSSVPLAISQGVGWVWQLHRVDVPPRLVHVPSGNLLRLVDLSARTIATVFEAPEPIVSVSVPAIASYYGNEPTEPRPILVRAGQTVYRLDHGYKLIGTFTIPAEIGRRDALLWYEIGAGRALAVYSRPEAGKVVDGGAQSQTILRIAADGTIRDSRELTLRARSNVPGEQAQSSLMALAVPAPVALLAAEALMAITADEAWGRPTAIAAVLERSWPALAAVLALSAVLAAIVWGWGRAFGLSRRERGVWAGFVLLFGVPGCAGFLLHRRWPVREPCPHCQARVARDRDTCAECGTPFPAPALQGIEIFA
jgi:hypothetical protein